MFAITELIEGVGFILELIFKGLLQWLFDMIINITEYLANSLLTIFSMDLSYFESNIPVTADIVNIMIGTGWALLLGNLVFQAAKSILSGLGFEGEDPRTLLGRTFVMSFLLVASRQVCDIGLSITKRVIGLLQVPEVVQVPQLTESTFSVPGDASWLLVIIIGVTLVVQIVKLFFEIGERYVIVAILTILSPLAFAMGGSKSTSDILKGWVRMFASMCLMVILSVVFLKLILSAMSVVPDGVEVVPWTVFIVALAKAGRKIDGIIARIGLTPAITGDSLGHSRLPGMLSYMVMKNVAGNIGNAAGSSKSISASSGKAGAAKLSPISSASGGGPSTKRSSVGKDTAKDGASYLASVPGGHSATAKSTEAVSHKTTAPSSEPATGDMTTPKGIYGTGMSGKSSRPPIGKTVETTAKDKPPATKPLTDGSKTTSSTSASSATTVSPSAKDSASVSKPSTHTPGKVTTPALETAKASAATGKIHSTATQKSDDKATARPPAPVTGKGAGAVTTSGKASGQSVSSAKTNVPSAEKSKPVSPSSSKSTGVNTAKTENAKPAKETISGGEKPTHQVYGTGETPKASSEASKQASQTRMSSTPVITGAGKAPLSQANTAHRQIPLPAKQSSPDSAAQINRYSRPQTTKAVEASQASSAAGANSNAIETPKNGEAIQTTQNKNTSEQVHGNAKDSYKSIPSRPDSKAVYKNEPLKTSETANQPIKNTGSASVTKPDTKTMASGIGIVNPAPIQTEKSASKPPITVSHAVPDNINKPSQQDYAADKAHNGSTHHSNRKKSRQSKAITESANDSNDKSIQGAPHRLKKDYKPSGKRGPK